MTKQEIIDLLRSNTASFLATVERGEPRVRGMMHYISPNDEIIYHTGKLKDVGQQMPEGSVVEMCAFDQNAGVQVRVRGKVQYVTDPAVIDALITERPFLKQIMDVIGKDAFLVVRIAEPKAAIWTMATNLAPKEWIEL